MASEKKVLPKNLSEKDLPEKRTTQTDSWCWDEKQVLVSISRSSSSFTFFTTQLSCFSSGKSCVQIKNLACISCRRLKWQKEETPKLRSEEKKVTWRRDQNHDTLIVINGVFLILTTNQGFSLLCSQRRLQTDQTDQVNLETSRGTTTRGDKNIIESLSPLCSATTLFSMSDKSNREFMINPLSEALVLTTLLINWQKAKKRLSRFCEQVKQSVWG